MQVGSFIPFILAAEGGGFKVNKSRIIEAIIIAAICGIGAGYIATERISVQVENLKAQLSAVSLKIDCLDNRLWQHQTQTEGKEK